MAPKRKLATANDSAAAVTRVTRSSTLLAKSTVAAPAADPEPPKKKKAKAKASTKQVSKAEPPSPPTENEAVAEQKVPDGSKTIVIEHCKQCNSFKTRAIQVKDALVKSVAGVSVLVNPEKPRRGCFEIREEGGEIFVTLLDMKRPFAPLKALDMEKVISDIVEKIQ